MLFDLKMTLQHFCVRKWFLSPSLFPLRLLFSTLPLPPLLYTPLPHLRHYSIAHVKRVIAQIIQRQLSVCDTGEHNHHHKQPLMALSGSSKITPQLSLVRCRAAGPNAVGTTVRQTGPNFTLMNLDLARLLQKAAMAIQYPPRWSKATPVATIHAREPSAMWKWREGGRGLWLFLSLAPVCSAQAFIPAHAQTHTGAYEQTQTCTCPYSTTHTLYNSHTQRRRDILHKHHAHTLLNTAILAVMEPEENGKISYSFQCFKIGENELFFSCCNEHIDSPPPKK